MANKFNLRTLLRVSIRLLVMSSLTQAGTITIGPGADCDFDSIQAGIDASVEGDTVLVAPGEYVITEPITFRGKAITVQSEAGSDQTTIRMGTPADTHRGSVVIFENGETTASVLDGFTITEGTGSWVTSVSASAGGGIFFDASSGTVSNCVIVQNRAKYGGGILCAYLCSPKLIDCLIAENSASVSGGGVFIWSESSMTITNCIVKGNLASEGSGGIQCWENASATMTYCTIAENSADVGGGVFGGENSLITMNHCVIINNTAYTGSGGMETWHQSSADVSNCVIARNTAFGLGGGGINCSIQGSATVINSVIWGNTAPKGREIWVRNAGTLSISYSNVSGGQAEATIEGGAINWGQGNIDADPCFTDPDNADYHLKSQTGRWYPIGQSWVIDDVTSPCIDAGDPTSPFGDEPEPNGGRINMGAYGGTTEASMSPFGAQEIVFIQWLGHSTVKVWTDEGIVYVDPERVPEALHDATIVCVTHTHGDHYSPADIAKVSNAQTQFVGPPDVVQQYGSGQTIAPGQAIEFDFVNVIAVPAYNTNKPNHPKSNNWVGYILGLGSRRIYVAGDTDLIEEMGSLGDIDVAFLPAGGTYTMNAVEAAEATQYIKPRLAIPYHWGQNVGTLADAQRFAELARCAVKILSVNETIGSDEWPEYQPLLAHWALDEIEGDIANDGADEHHGALNGGPTWLPTGGRIDGALQFDGVDDFVSTPFVLDPAEGVFSAFAWIKGDVTGQAILSQEDGAGKGEIWLSADSVGGYLVSGLVPPPAGRTVTPALESHFIITDGQWHHIGFVWDGRRRHLYVDGVEVAADNDAINPLTSSDGGMIIGAGKSLGEGSFFVGLIDDVRIYNQALDEQEVKALTQ